MAKRYHQSKKDRRDESKGMKRRLSDGDYSGYDDRREMEARDSRMISEDHSAMANLPQQPVMKYYPRNDYERYDLDDTQSGIDRQMNDDVRGAKRHRSKSKY